MRNLILQLVRGAAALSLGLCASACTDELRPDTAPMVEDGRIAFSGIGEVKGNSITSETLQMAFERSGINIRAIHDSSDYFLSNEKLYPGAQGFWDTAKPYYWPSSGSRTLSFWAWAVDESNGAEISRIDTDKDHLSFHYRMPLPSADKQDACRQSELLLAGKADADRQNCLGGVPLVFQHALASVKVNVGRANAGILRSITLSGIASEADCELSTASPLPVWSAQSGRTSFSQVFDLSIVGNLEGNHLQDVSTSSKGEEDGTIFMMIPQQLEDASISIDYMLSGKDSSEVFTSPLKGSWMPGRSYTYTLSILGGLSVCIDGVFTREETDAVGFTNDGECPCYLRATMVGTWDNDAGEIVQPAGGSDNIVIRDPLWSEFWFFDPDSHIYYYRYPLRGGESVKVKLFDRLTAAQGPEGSHLNVTVMVQAIKQESDMQSVIQAIGTANGYIDQLYRDFYDNS